jgi:uncharacterized membrane protein
MSVLAFIISFLAGIGVFGIRRGNGWRAAFLQSAIVHCTILVIATEILSGTHSILPEAIQTLWFGVATIHIIALRLRFKEDTFESLNRNKSNTFRFFQQLKPLEKISLIGIFAIFLICLVTAVIAAPNNYDSMTYHMTRVMHWIQNQSVDHYPTHNLRQLAFPPGASYILMHLELLVGNDYLVNLMQWTAFVGSTLGISLVAKYVTGPQTQIMTALVCASLPMAIMQSTTTQNDLLTGFWLVCTVYFIVRTDAYKIRDLIWIALSLSLAIVTKSTAIILGFALIIWFNVRYLMRQSNRGEGYMQKLGFINAAILFGVISLSIPHFLRNLYAFGNPLMDIGTRNTFFGIETVGSNLLRTICLNLPLRHIWQATEAFHNLMGWDVGSEETTFFASRHPFMPPTDWHFLLPNEGSVGSPIHLIFFMAAGVAFTRNYYMRLSPRSKQNSYLSQKEKEVIIPPPELQLLIAILLSMITYCLLVKWQIWANRLILPLFILGTPLTASYLGNKISKDMRWTVVCVLIFFSIFYSLTPMHHPLIGLSRYMTNSSQSESILSISRERMYMSVISERIYEKYLRAVENAGNIGCSTIGLHSNDDSVEYPLWIFLEKRLKHPIKIKHVDVKNKSADLKPEFSDKEICMFTEALS